MSPKKVGKRHPLLLYQQNLKRLFGPTLWIGIALGVLYWAGTWYDTFLDPPADLLVLASAMMALMMAAFLYLARRMVYVQTFPDHLRIVTPFLRLKISYQRMRSVRSAHIQQLFPPDRVKGSTRRMLEPFYTMTVVVIMLKGYPLSPQVLKLFLPKPFFVPRQTGFVLITPDWMDLSTDIDTAIGNFRQARSRRNEDRISRYYTR